jgi:hypothetical protein
MMMMMMMMQQKPNVIIIQILQSYAKRKLSGKLGLGLLLHLDKEI